MQRRGIGRGGLIDLIGNRTASTHTHTHQRLFTECSSSYPRRALAASSSTQVFEFRGQIVDCEAAQRWCQAVQAGRAVQTHRPRQFTVKWRQSPKPVSRRRRPRAAHRTHTSSTSSSSSPHSHSSPTISVCSPTPAGSHPLPSPPSFVFFFFIPVFVFVFVVFCCSSSSTVIVTSGGLLTLSVANNPLRRNSHPLPLCSLLLPSGPCRSREHAFQCGKIKIGVSSDALRKPHPSTQNFEAVDKTTQNTISVKVLILMCPYSWRWRTMRASGPKVLYDPDWGGLVGSQYQHLRRCFTVRSFPCRSPKPVPEFTDKYVNWASACAALLLPHGSCFHASA
ncbi:uncharacterized protein [Physcomitrium patens]|uniref:uncharacterized protein n=1 Tax=Physcomitrium patens TaxID=3218 RepID=UPI000D1700C5|nr:uncharacterized protein LOC112276516 [Physcomitrium patens]|eukprot:XP_024363678.1 uncharacterized protein LOC112276516 [Physcomitrella patens]